MTSPDPYFDASHAEDDDSSSSPTEIPDWAVIITAVSAVLISILGFFGNLLTILALPHVRKLRNAATWFVVNLAVIEMVFCVTILPMSAAHLFHLKITKERLFDDNGCRLFVFLRFVIIQAELLSIAAIALNRCILIAVPKKYSRVFTPKKTALFIVGIWAVSIFVMVFPLSGIYGAFSYNSRTNECDFDEQSRVARKVYLAIGFLIPCLIIIVSYSYIFYKSWKSTKRIRAMTDNASLTSEAVRPATGLRNRDMRIARTIAVIFLVFLICCTPVSVAHYYGSQGQIPLALLLMHPLYWLQYCLNSLIYVFMNKQYREAYISYISHWWPKFQEITQRFYEPTEDEASVSLPGSRHGAGPVRKNSDSSKKSSVRSKKNSVTRMMADMDSPLPSPNQISIPTKPIEYNTATPDSRRKLSRTPIPDIQNHQHVTADSADVMGTYKTIRGSVKQVTPKF